MDDEGRLKIGYPTIFKVHDRRGWDRVQLEADILASFELKGKSWNKKSFDLGSGGMSIVLIKRNILGVNSGKNMCRNNSGRKKLFANAQLLTFFN